MDAQTSTNHTVTSSVAARRVRPADSATSGSAQTRYHGISHVVVSAPTSAAAPAALAHLRVRHAYSPHTATPASRTASPILRTVASAPPRPAANPSRFGMLNRLTRRP